MSEKTCTELVRIRPKDGAKARLIELRPLIMKEIDAKYPGSAEAFLYEAEDGTWLDVWNWATREDAEDALADPSKFPAFSEWLGLVDLVSFEWATPQHV
jgi:hypothetical protein